jgi:hypothetical protein
MKTRFATALAIALFVALPFTVHAQATKGTTKSATTKTKTKPATKTEKPTSATKPAKPETKVAKSDTKAVKPTTRTVSKPPTNPGPKNPTAIAAVSKNPTAAAHALDKEPKDATAECKDHTYAHTAGHLGACANHGGVLKFFK